MKFYLWSDIHNEFGKVDFNPEIFDPDSSLVIAGDWGTSSCTQWSLIEPILRHFRHVFFVSGNHDYYGETIQNVDDFWKRKDDNFDNFHYLNPGSFEVDGIKIVGATLWTDLYHAHPMVLHNAHYMNDFHHIKNFSTDRWLEIHQAHKSYIEGEISEERKILLVTHHAPHSFCVPDRFKSEREGNAFFHCTDIDHIIDPVYLHAWFHGHIHDVAVHKINDVNVCANPRGYVKYESKAVESWVPNTSFIIGE